jgi:hypothetical protein
MASGVKFRRFPLGAVFEALISLKTYEGNPTPALPGGEKSPRIEKNPGWGRKFLKKTLDILFKRCTLILLRSHHRFFFAL